MEFIKHVQYLLLSDKGEVRGAQRNYEVARRITPEVGNIKRFFFITRLKVIRRKDDDILKVYVAKAEERETFEDVMQRSPKEVLMYNHRCKAEKITYDCLVED